jgi:hypothetical protein
VQYDIEVAVDGTKRAEWGMINISNIKFRFFEEFYGS